VAARERATEVEYLKWFRTNADFGPATGDVVDALSEDFIQTTGKDLPEGWNYYQDGETLTDSYEVPHGEA
jgi:hypothetical protein